jgi:hypothetical protein
MAIDPIVDRLAQRFQLGQSNPVDDQITFLASQFDFSSFTGHCRDADKHSTF